MAQKPALLVGLDIGTTKVCCVVGEVQPSGNLHVVGLGTAPSHGLRKGVIIDMEDTAAAIGAATTQAQVMAGCTIEHAYVGVAGAHVQSVNGHGAVNVRQREVTALDVARVMEAARAEMQPSAKKGAKDAVAERREVIHILPQEYIVDAQDGIREPVGMVGTRLQSKVHIVTGNAAAAQNIVRCVQRCNLQVDHLVLEPLASSEAVLSADERELGVALIDVGGGTTDVAVWSDGNLVHTAVLPVGGDHFTQDIALGLHTPHEEAEKIKREYGAAMAAMVGKDETFAVAHVGGRAPRMISKQLLCEIIEPRAEEIFALVKQELARSGHEELLASGVVLTGGASLLHGMAELAEDTLGAAVRRGAPVHVRGLVDLVANPMCATAVGLLHYGHTHEGNPYLSLSGRTVYTKVKEKVRTWLGDIF